MYYWIIHIACPTDLGLKKIGKEKWFKGLIEGASGLLKLVVLDLGTFVLLTLLSKPLLFWEPFCSIHWEQNLGLGLLGLDLGLGQY